MSVSSDPSDFVPFTARMMAAIRALESERSDRLFHDPFAAQLAGEEAQAEIQARLTPQDLTYVAVRTRFFDDFIQANVPPLSQVVILAAGMDTRPYRLPCLDSIAVYELDQPGVLEFKSSILQAVPLLCHHHQISADLTQPWRDRLLDSGFQPDQPSLWLLEGLLMYLSEREVRQVLTTISELAHANSKLGLDLINPASVDYAPYKGYFQSGFESPEDLLADYGWSAIAHQPGEEATSYGRYTTPVPERSLPNVQRIFLVTARRV